MISKSLFWEHFVLGVSMWSRESKVYNFTLFFWEKWLLFLEIVSYFLYKFNINFMVRGVPMENDVFHYIYKKGTSYYTTSTVSITNIDFKISSWKQSRMICITALSDNIKAFYIINNNKTYLLHLPSKTR